MSSEAQGDPRQRTLHATQEEIDAWSEREQRRRAAWLAGPSTQEKQEWMRRYRWRASLGLEESRLGPTTEDVEQWAQREHGRRAAWLAGPSAAEMQAWATSQRHRAGIGLPESRPTDEEMHAWSAHEQQRRQQWLAGPSEEEKLQWAQRQGQGLLDDLMSLPEMLEAEVPEAAQRFLREAELAGKGALYALSRGPLSLWSYLVRSGRDFEEEVYQRPARRRVDY